MYGTIHPRQPATLCAEKGMLLRPEKGESWLRRFRTLWGDLPVDCLDEQQIEEWCGDRVGHFPSVTLKAERQVLRVLLRWAASRNPPRHLSRS